jgi:MFS family permease
VAQTAGMIAGALAVGMSDRRILRPQPMLLVAVAALVVATIGWFPGLVVAMAVSGIAIYAINARAQSELSALAGPYRARALSLFHVGGGAGAFLTPLAIAGLLAVGVSWRAAFLFVAAALLVYAPWASRWGHATAPRMTLRVGRLPPRARWALAVATLALGVQLSVPLWLAQLVHDDFGVSVAAASAVTAVYCAALFIARLTVATSLPRLGEGRVLGVCSTSVVIGLVLLGIAPDAPTVIAAAALIGGSVGPILALGMARLAVASGDDRLAASAVMAGGGAAAIVLPAATVALEPVVGLQLAVAALAVPAVVVVIGVWRSAVPLTAR